MRSLREQLKVDLQNLFTNNEDYPEYQNTLVKQKYEKYPEITYPIVTIDELNNEAVDRYLTIVVNKSVIWDIK